MGRNSCIRNQTVVSNCDSHTWLVSTTFSSEFLVPLFYRSVNNTREWQWNSLRSTAVRLVSLRLRALTLEKRQLLPLSIWFTIKYTFKTSGNWHGLREGLPTEWMPEPLFNFDGYLDSRARKGTNNFDPALIRYPFTTLSPPWVTHPVVSS